MAIRKIYEKAPLKSVVVDLAKTYQLTITRTGDSFTIQFPTSQGVSGLPEVSMLAVRSWELSDLKCAIEEMLRG